MAEKSGFFNSNSGDRIYNAEDFASYFGDLVSNGIFHRTADNLRVTAASGMNVLVLAGSAWINGYRYTKLYSGGVPELIEGDIFKTIIPLASSLGKQANNKRIKQANKTSEKRTVIVNYIEEHGKVAVHDLTEIFNLSEGRVRAILLEMTKEKIIQKVGKTKSAYYVLK